MAVESSMKAQHTERKVPIATAGTFRFFALTLEGLRFDVRAPLAVSVDPFVCGIKPSEAKVIQETAEPAAVNRRGRMQNDELSSSVYARQIGHRCSVVLNCAGPKCVYIISVSA